VFSGQMDNIIIVDPHRSSVFAVLTQNQTNARSPMQATGQATAIGVRPTQTVAASGRSMCD